MPNAWSKPKMALRGANGRRGRKGRTTRRRPTVRGVRAMPARATMNSADPARWAMSAPAARRAMPIVVGPDRRRKAPRVIGRRLRAATKAAHKVPRKTSRMVGEE